MGVIAAMAGAVLFLAIKTREVASDAGCLTNLRQVTNALRTYAMDNGGYFPDPGAAEQPWERMIAKYLPDTTRLVCPADKEIAPLTGSSYDWRDTTLPQSTLAGKLITDVRRTTAVLTIESLPGWHAKDEINVGRVDGSCTTMGANEAMADLLQPVR